MHLYIKRGLSLAERANLSDHSVTLELKRKCGFPFSWRVINCDKIYFLEKYVMEIFFITNNNFYFFVKTKPKNRKNSEEFAKTYSRKFFIFPIFLQVIFAKMQKRIFSFQHFITCIVISQELTRLCKEEFQATENVEERIRIVCR